MITKQVNILNINELSYNQYKKLEEDNNIKPNELYLVREADPMMVTISKADDGGGKADYTSTQIYSHLEKGGHALISYEDADTGANKYVPIVSCSKKIDEITNSVIEGEATALDVSGTASVMVHRIDYAGNYSLVSHGIGDIVDAISALESINTQLKNGTLGVITFTINGELFTAPAGSDWGTWWTSEHNTIDAVSSLNTQYNKYFIEVKGGYIAQNGVAVQSSTAISPNGEYEYISSLSVIEG